MSSNDFAFDYVVNIAGNNNETKLLLASDYANMNINYNNSNLNNPSILNKQIRESLKSLIDTGKDLPDLSSLLNLLTSNNLVSPLSETFTILAPSNNAFTKNEKFLSKLDSIIIKDILLSHVVVGTVLSSDLSNGMVLKTLGSMDISVEISGNNVMLNSPGSKVNVTKADTKSSNGVVHLIDDLLLPKLPYAYYEPSWNLLSSYVLENDNDNK